MRSLFFVVSITPVLFFPFFYNAPNPVDKLHSKDLVVVTLKKKKSRRKKNVKISPRKRCVRMYVQVYDAPVMWCISFPPPLLLSLLLQLHFPILHPFFIRFFFFFFYFFPKPSMEKDWFEPWTNWHCSSGQSIESRLIGLIINSNPIRSIALISLFVRGIILPEGRLYNRPSGF